MSLLCKTTWLLTALAAIHVGAIALGHDVFAMAPLATTLAGAALYIKYALGVAGVISLVQFGLSCSNSSCSNS